VYSQSEIFKFLGFALGKNGKGIYIRVHAKAMKKFKSQLKALSSRRAVQSIRPSLKKLEVYVRGWMNYYGIASMKAQIESLNGWLCRRIRMCIWKMWKKPKTRYRNLRKLGVPEDLAYMTANSRKKYWRTSKTVALHIGITKRKIGKEQDIMIYPWLTNQ